jgi:uncharacterized Tic20 family protein
MKRVESKGREYADMVKEPSQDKIRIKASIIVLTIILIFLVVLLSVFGLVSSDNAVVVSAMLALAGVLITQMVNTDIARATQKDQREHPAPFWPRAPGALGRED